MVLCLTAVRRSAAAAAGGRCGVCVWRVCGRTRRREPEGDSVLRVGTVQTHVVEAVLGYYVGLEVSRGYQRLW